MSWTDIWCFTCQHELKRDFGLGYEHVDPGEAEPDTCVCTEDGIKCEPR